MEFYITGKDDNTIDFVANPHHVSKVLTNQKEVYENLKELQKATDSVVNNRRGREADIKVIARFPQGLLIKLLEIEPDLLKDKKSFWRILNKYPIYKAYTTGASNWQTRY